MKTKALTLSLAMAFSMSVLATDEPEFEFIDVRVDTDGVIAWQTCHEDADLIYYVEQWVYNEWTVIKEIEPLGEEDTSLYAISVLEEMHSGDNTFRIKREPVNYISIISDEVTVESDLPKVYHFKKGNEITLSKRVKFFITNENGLLITEGFGSVIDLSDYDKGSYFICFDNQVAEIKKGGMSF